MKRVVAILCVLAAGVLLLLLLTRSPDDPEAGPGPAPAPANRPARPPASPVVSPPPATPTRPTAEPPPAGNAVSGLKYWAPHGRVVNRATGDPISWTNLTYQIRFQISEENAISWSEERDSPAGGDEPPKDPGAFDLGDSVRNMQMDHHASQESLAVAEFRVRARAPGFAKASTDWMRWADFPRDRDLLVEMDIDAPSKLLAHVRTGEGVPFRGRARLSLYDGEVLQGTDAVEADAEGALAFEGLPSGRYRVSMEPEGPSDGSILHVNGDGSAGREILLPPGGRAEAAFVLARVGEITVDVAAVDGSAVEAWVVDYQYRRGSGSGGASPRRLTGCPPGDYELKVWAKGFLEWKTTVRVDAGATARVEALLERAPGSDFLKRVPEEVVAWLDRNASELAKGDSLEAARLALLRATKDDVWDQLAAASGFGDRGPEVRAEIQEAWRNRAKDVKRTTSYGSGSFVVLARPAGAGQADGTAEAWWKGATADQRKDWLLSWSAEKGGLMEVVRVRDDPCPDCGEPGDRKATEPQPGKAAEGQCSSCHGSKVLRTVLWR